ncbi:MAG: hypothetical protein M0Q49_04585 [Porticoccaceae bacterium]|nr:hypothetical protein [Porticoccaceae bacterium]
MIGQSTTRSRKPSAPPLTDGVFLGAVSQATHSTSVELKTRIYDDFENGVDDWVNVRGRLTTTGGSSPDITADMSIFDPLSYVVGAAGYHRTELLSDNCRAKIVVPDGLIVNGTSQFWFCGDRAMDNYYGIQVSTVLGISTLAIIKGTSPNSMRRFELTLQSLQSGDEIEGWYDRPNSTLRMYHEGNLLKSLPVAPTEIPHGPGRRWCGVIMASDWWIAPGGNFASFEAWDV